MKNDDTLVKYKLDVDRKQMGCILKIDQWNS